MEKKTYSKCDIQVVVLQPTANLLTASGEPSGLHEAYSEGEQLSRSTNNFSLWDDEDDYED